MNRMIEAAADTVVSTIVSQNVRTGLDPDTLRRAVLDYLLFFQGRHPAIASRNDFYLATAYAVRDRLFQRGVKSLDLLFQHPEARTVAYLSAEFLIGPQLAASLINLGIYESMQKALAALDVNLEDLIEHEREPGLGNGGLGRLAACYLDSLATLEVPAIGYGIRYEFGIFDQVIRDGWQVELTDKWLHLGFPWEVARPERAVNVYFGGHTERYVDELSRPRVRWRPAETVLGVPHDTPILGYRVDTCNLLRLWCAQAVETFDFAAFNVGDYQEAVEQKVTSETISKVLYPNDVYPQGKVLRLKQQYFFVACAIQDMMRSHIRSGGKPENFHLRWAAQLNDTHPAVAVAELMRLLIDEHGLAWDIAWDVTRKTMAYTNHTLMPEALECWSVELFGALLPRHLEIIFEINEHFLDDVRLRFPGDDGRVSRMSLIDENNGRHVRMANLACAGSHAINGVAELHTELLKRQVLPDWVDMYPERFVNITNGVTPRRFLILSNPGLTRLISDHIGDAWPTHLDALRGLEAFVRDPHFRQCWRDVKRENKVRLAKSIKERTGIIVDPDSLFDIQVKRIHEYKRQHLNVLHIITLYRRLKANPDLDMVPRTFIFGGKAAPGYQAAKLIIKLVNAAGELINSDPDVRDRLKVVFFPDFDVKKGQWIYPAADISEQISTAGLEASGTGNMKFAMNGALTVGTLDGANIEIREEVGAENFFLFGLTAEEVNETKQKGYVPRALYEQNVELRGAIELIGSGALSRGDPNLFRPLLDGLLWHDPFMLLADYQSYVDCQDGVSALWRNREEWTRKSILNVARTGKFSSDRSIRDYCEKIWRVKPLNGKSNGGT
jgi:starch phosphorylase